MQLAAASVRRRRQSGAALIEFALVLPLLLAIAVGIIYYGYAFVLKTAVENAAKNGAQEMVAVSPLKSNYAEQYEKRALDAVQASLYWLPYSAQVIEGGECEGAYGVVVSLPLTSGENPVLPQFSLGRFHIPPLGSGDDANAPAIHSTACVTL